MGKRDFLLSMGPYRNIFMTEDREWWARLIKQKALITLKHTSFKTRLSRTPREKIKKLIYVTFFVMSNDFWGGTSFFKYLLHIFKNAGTRYTFKRSILRACMVPGAWIYSKLKTNPMKNERYPSLEEVVRYRNENSGTYPEMMKKFGLPVNWDDLSPESESIFS